MADRPAENPDRTRVSLSLTTLLWISAIATLLLGLKLHVRPIVLLGGINALLALVASLLVSAGRPRRR